jgi:alpha-glucosidase
MKTSSNTDFPKTSLYEIYVRSFYDSNGDGVGDLPGIIEKLDYLAGSKSSLGISAIWLTPFYPSPMADFGYDVTDHCNVDPLFGSLDDFKKLLKEAHSRSLQVLVDFIPNHTSNQHPWFNESKASIDSPYRSWYVWRDPKPDGSPPNNWRSIIGEPAWEFDKTTNQYYLHSFLPEQPDLNWENSEVRQAMKKVLQFWSKLGVDGFRIDSMEWVSKDPELRDDPIDPHFSAEVDPNAYHSLLHLNSKRGPHLDEYLEEIAEIIHDYPHQLILIESHPHNWDDSGAYLRFYQDSSAAAIAPFNFEALSSPWEANSYRTFVDHFQGVLKTHYLPVYAFGNHDTSRLASRIGIAAAPTAAMLQLGLPGIPIIYYGDELGMVDEVIDSTLLKDRFGMTSPSSGLGRDPERTPLSWNDNANGGFTTGSPWLPVATNFKDINVATELKESSSLLNLYRQLIMLRNKTNVFEQGSYESYSLGKDIFCFQRFLDDEDYVVVLNFSDQPISVNNPITDGVIVLSTYLDKYNLKLSGQFLLLPNEGLIIQKPLIKN